MYQEIIDKCRQAYKEHNLKLAYDYWGQMFEVFNSKLEKAKDTKETQELYEEFFNYTIQVPDQEVYDITDYGREQSYMQMERERYQSIYLNDLSGGYDLDILQEFCDFYEWRPVKTDNGFNIFDLQLNELVEDEDYQTFTELINRIVGRALDYFMDEEEWDENNKQSIEYGLELCDIAKKYTNGTKWDEDWLNNIEKELKNLSKKS